MIEVRIAIAVDCDGQYEASASNNEDGLTAMENAICWLIERGGKEPFNTYWITSHVEPIKHTEKQADNVEFHEVTELE